MEERILTLESLVYDKDSIIHDLQRKLDKALRVSAVLLPFADQKREMIHISIALGLGRRRTTDLCLT